MDNVFLKPALDADGNAMVVPDPETHRPLKAEGEWKPMSTYWARRIRDLDAIPSDPKDLPPLPVVVVSDEGPTPQPAASLPDEGPTPLPAASFADKGPTPLPPPAADFQGS